MEGGVTSPTELLNNLVLAIVLYPIVSAQRVVAVGPAHQHQGLGGVQYVQKVNVVLAVRGGLAFDQAQLFIIMGAGPVDSLQSCCTVILWHRGIIVKTR